MSEKTYPRVVIDLKKLRNNIDAIIGRCNESGIDVAGVTKCVSSLPEVARQFEEGGAKFIASSRINQLQRLKDAGIKTPLMLIRIPMLSEVEKTVELADVSLVSEVPLIGALDRAAQKAGRKHGVILMDDLGDLREGFWDQGQLIDAAMLVEEAPGLELMGIGTNLGCYGSVMATPEKLEELVRDAEAIEDKIGRHLRYISGGATSSIPRILEGNMPSRINMLRIGEGIIVARDLIELYDYKMDYMETTVSKLQAEVIEVKVKPTHPVGEIGYDAFRRQPEYVDRGMRKRAIIAVGKIDYSFETGLTPLDEGVEVIGASSDHTLLDIEDAKRDIKVGDILEFNLDYGALVFLTQTSEVAVETV